jgi:hypothetical protein
MSSEPFETSKQPLGGMTRTVLTDDAVDPIYQAKAHILNDALQEIGMGRYQWYVVHLFGSITTI